MKIIMKKHLGFIVLLLFSATIAKAQICKPDTNMTNPGLEPLSDSLDCFVQGDSTERTVFFKNYDTVDFANINAEVDWIQIDRVYNLPCGINWTTNKANASNPHRFQNLEEGCIQLTGVTNDPPGQYKLEMRVTAKIGSPVDVEIGGIDADTVGLRYDVRVKKNPGDTCVAVDTTITGNTTSCPDPNWIDTTSDTTSVEDQASSDIKNAQLAPHPFTYKTNLVFHAKQGGTYQLTLMNMLGEKLRSQSVDVTNGTNDLTIKRKGLNQGMYILKLTSEHGSSMTKKIVVGGR